MKQYINSKEPWGILRESGALKKRNEKSKDITKSLSQALERTLKKRARRIASFFPCLFVCLFFSFLLRTFSSLLPRQKGQYNDFPNIIPFLHVLAYDQFCFMHMLPTSPKPSPDYFRAKGKHHDFIHKVLCLYL